MKYRFLLLGFLCSSLALQAQQLINSTRVPFVIAPKASVNVADIHEDWFPALQHIQAPKPDGNAPTLQALKDSVSKRYPRKSQGSATPTDTPKGIKLKKTATLTAPFLGRNFQGNVYSASTPNDNDIAISNADEIVSVQNATILTTNASATASKWMSLSAFSYKLGNPHSKYDPKTIYDPIADKYVVVFLNGFTDSTSSITVAFSNTSNPNGTWSMYELPGNPFDNGLWTDYPIIALSKDELFITVNLLYPDSSWQTGFVESLIWQVDKNDGYNGLALHADVHHDIKHNGRPIRNLCPVRGGATLYGPDMYFLSQRNLDIQNDTVFLLHLSDTLFAPGQSLSVTTLSASPHYFMPPNALQPGPSGTQTLATNDSRMLGAFIENNKIQYVHNSLDTATGHPAIYHGIIQGLGTTATISGHIIADTLLELGYPNIAYAGTAVTDDAAIISFDHAAATVYPGISAVMSDGLGSYSPLSTVKHGVDYLRVLGGNERWGDYSGAQRKYNQPGRVWVNGLYANTSKQNTTWIAELSPSSLANIAQQPAADSDNDISIFPNPSTNLISVQLQLAQQSQLSFRLYDASGRLVKVLLRERVKAGSSQFSFSIAPLASGIYTLRVSDASSTILSRNIHKQ